MVDVDFVWKNKMPQVSWVGRAVALFEETGREVQLNGQGGWRIWGTEFRKERREG